MRWTVDGVEANTGRPAKLSVEARDLAEARRLAAYNGIVAAGDVPPPPVPLAYRVPGEPVAVPAPPPEDEKIVRVWPKVVGAAILLATLSVPILLGRRTIDATQQWRGDDREAARLEDLSRQEGQGKDLTPQERSELQLLRARQAERDVHRLRRGE